MTSTPPVALTIAGSDSGGGAGAQVDLKTFAAHQVFGVSALTAITVQNTCEVRAVHPVPPEVVAAQIECLLDDFSVGAAKTGMLAQAATVEAVASVLSCRPLPHLVVDPVLVSSTGTRLLDDQAVSSYVELLFPLATLVTPNMGEASVFTSRPVASLHDMEEAAKAIHHLGARCVLVKGGHLTDHIAAVDVLYDGSDLLHLTADWVKSENVHGTGCTLSAAIAARLARGSSLTDAVSGAKNYVRAAIDGAAGWSLGMGHGPLDHFGWTG